MITTERIGPAGDPDGQVARDRLGAEPAQAQAKLDRQLKATAAAERKVAELARKLEDLKSLSLAASSAAGRWTTTPLAVDA